MRIDPSRALGAYAAVMTAVAGWLLLGAGTAPQRFGTIDVERINVREPDGTLRLAISSHARFPGLIVGGHEYPHPRPEAGMIFYNDEGDENGGLVFDGGRRGPTNGGSLTFDRWHQDQTLQLVSTEDGAAKRVGVVVNDRPDAPMDMAGGVRAAALPPGPARTAAIARANAGGARRVWLGRETDGTAALTLADAAGRPRLRLAVGAAGAPAVELLGADGAVAKRVALDR